jgi:hypothetical protein
MRKAGWGEADLRLPRLPRPEHAQHGHVACIGVPAGVGVHDIDDPVPLARHLPCAGVIATGKQAGMETKPFYGVSDRLKASFGSCPRAGLRLPPVDGVQVYSRLIRQAYASSHRRDSTAGLREWQFVIGAQAIYPSRHRFERDHAPRGNRGAGLGDHLGLTRDTLFFRRRSFPAGG